MSDGSDTESDAPAAPGSFSSHLVPTQRKWDDIRAILRRVGHPTGATAASLRDYIDEAPGELERYEEEMEAVREVFQRLEVERRMIEKQAEACESAFAPVRVLPPEVLLRVFWFLSPVETSKWMKNTMRTREYDYDSEDEEEQRSFRKTTNLSDLTAASQACSLWRRLITDTSVLWSTIHAALPDDDKFASRKLAHCLLRSGTRPLDFTLVDPKSGENSLIHQFMDYAKRWRHVDITLNTSHPIYTSMGTRRSMFDDLHGRLPLLETLRISSALPLEDTSGFEIAPRLTRVVFTDGPPSKLPWAQIRYVEGTRRRSDSGRSRFFAARWNRPRVEIDLRGTLAFIASCAAHTHVVLPPIQRRLSRPAGAPSGQAPQRITSPLASICIPILRGYDTPDNTQALLGDVLDLLRLPDLHTLHIHSADYTRRSTCIPLPLKAFLGFLASQHITTLILRDVLITLDELHSFLPSMPTLEGLFLQDANRADEEEARQRKIRRRRNGQSPDSEADLAEEPSLDSTPIVDHVLICDDLFRLLAATCLRLRTLLVLGFFDAQDMSDSALFEFLRARPEALGMKVKVCILHKGEYGEEKDDDARVKGVRARLEGVVREVDSVESEAGRLGVLNAGELGWCIRGMVSVSSFGS
ncbi:hypothetical protein HMN09_01392800 [Mycena chlorophos]|uniref:F-box domain-containing protein n=1 Tax=Mycena chlorophos TaxID=658473 RepID=A0A8H6RWX6_MYCCL|nr:hypothetical protein HMN09_01392800 [Mycena chlorophos]